MKKSIFLIILLAGSMNMSAYTPLVEEGKQWSVLTHSDIFGEEVQYRYSTQLYKIEGEENVNGVTYKKLLATSNEAADNWTAAALLREENKKVYVLLNGIEYLMYDFDIEKGSKIAIYPSLYYIKEADRYKDNEDDKIGTVEYEVSDVEIVKNRKGEDIKKYIFKDTQFIYYEGYGNDFGWMRFADDGLLSDSGDYLICVHNSKNELEYFSNPPYLEGVNLEDGECYAWGEVKTAVNETSASSDLIFYDNASESIRLYVDGEKNVIVYDMQGRTVFSATTSDNELSFNAEPGLYIVKVTASGNDSTGKIAVRI